MNSLINFKNVSIYTCVYFTMKYIRHSYLKLFLVLFFFEEDMSHIFDFSILILLLHHIKADVEFRVKAVSFNSFSKLFISLFVIPAAQSLHDNDVVKQRTIVIHSNFLHDLLIQLVDLVHGQWSSIIIESRFQKRSCLFDKR